MPPRPEKLVILRSWISTLAQFLPFLLLWIGYQRFTNAPKWFDAIGLFFTGVWCLNVLYFGFSRQYVVIDDSGVRRTLPLSRRRWSQIEACACRNEKGQRILRIFLLQDTAKTPPPADCQEIMAAASARNPSSHVKSAMAESYFDIDFNLAERPQQSLEKAFQTCVGFIAATRARSATDSPIREFVEDWPIKTPTNWPKVIVIGLLGGAGVVLILLFMFHLVSLLSP